MVRFSFRTGSFQSHAASSKEFDDRVSAHYAVAVRRWRSRKGGIRVRADGFAASTEPDGPRKARAFGLSVKIIHISEQEEMQ